MHRSASSGTFKLSLRMDHQVALTMRYDRDSIDDKSVRVSILSLNLENAALNCGDLNLKPSMFAIRVAAVLKSLVVPASVRPTSDLIRKN